jgi:methylglyoxal synthase
MQPLKRIALVAHDDRKDDLVDWVRTNAGALQRHRFWATGTTGRRVGEACPSLDLTALKSGPLGGDQQLGARIAQGEIDILIFFIDPLSPMPHDVDVKALTRLSTLYNVATATNRATADFLITSPLFAAEYQAPTGGGDGEPGR